MTGKITFLGETADQQFRNWQGESVKTENRKGFYLNIRSNKNAMIHQADCKHLGVTDDMNSTSNSKVCSDDYVELKEWANKNYPDYKLCSDCIK